MNIVTTFSKNTTLKLQVIAMMLMIVIASISFALNSQPAPVAMKRESRPVVGEIVLSLDQALNLSLACGDYRRVNVDWAEVA